MSNGHDDAPTRAVPRETSTDGPATAMRPATAAEREGRASSGRSRAPQEAADENGPGRTAPRARPWSRPSSGASSQRVSGTEKDRAGDPRSQDSSDRQPGRPAAGEDSAGRRPVVAGTGSGRPAPVRPAPPRAAARPAETRRSAPRRIRLTLKKVDPWSVFVFSLAVTFFLGIALVVAVVVLYSVLDGAGVVSSVNDLVKELTSSPDPVLTSQRALTVALVLAGLEIVLFTLLATIGALLYNLCASFTGGLDLTLGERE